MKIVCNQTKSANCGLTLVEVLAVLAVLVLTAFLFLPSVKPSRKLQSIVCMNNLKLIGLGLNIYADDNDGKYPFQISMANGGTMELISNNHVFSRYQKAASNLGGEPKILICPFDTRKLAADFETLTDSNISYFLNADAARSSPTLSLLSGDRFLRNNGQPVKAGLFVLTTNLQVSWTPGIHKGSGNVLWSDGSIQQPTSRGWPALMQSQSFATNRLLIP